VGRGGGAGVVATDMCEREGLSVPRLSVDMKTQLGKIIPSLAGSSVGNPVEIGLGALGFSEHYAEAVGILNSNPQIDFIITFFFPAEYEEYLQEGWLETASSQLLMAKKSIAKPLIAVVDPGESIDVFKWAKRLQQRCLEMELPTFLRLEDAIKAMSKLIKYYEFKSNTNQ
jgi:acyl-CoA synthetase (NDP forming)